MFILEEQISEWRQQMLAAGIGSPAPLEELESHLWEEIEQLMRAGTSESDAFFRAQAQIGQAQVLKTEFASLREPVFERLKRLIHAFAGIPYYQLVTTMNTTGQNLEPRWATYLKTAAFFVPAFLVLVGICTFVLPKFKELWSHSHLAFGGSFVFLLNFLDLIRTEFITLSLAAIALVVLLEWRFDRWPRHRRLVLGILAYAFNLLVLILIAAMAVLAVVAGANLLPGK